MKNLNISFKGQILSIDTNLLRSKWVPSIVQTRKILYFQNLEIPNSNSKTPALLGEHFVFNFVQV